MGFASREATTVHLLWVAAISRTRGCWEKREIEGEREKAWRRVRALELLAMAGRRHQGLKLRDGFELRAGKAVEATIVEEEANKMGHLLLTRCILLFQTNFYVGPRKMKFREWAWGFT